MTILEYRQAWLDWYRGRFPLHKKELSVAVRLRKEGATPATMHACCFIGFVALKTGVATADEVLGDFGLVHEAAHALHIGEPDHTAETVAAIADVLEGRLKALTEAEFLASFDVVDVEAEDRRVRKQQMRNG